MGAKVLSSCCTVNGKWCRQTQNDHTSSMKSIIRYSGLAFGIGYLLLFFGLVAIYLETAARTGEIPGLGSTSIMSIPPAMIAVAIFLFLAVICGIAFGASVIRDSNWRNSNATVGGISTSVTAFSLILLFTGLALAILMSLIPTYSSSSFLPYGLSSSAWFSASICLIIGSVFLLIGYRMFAKGLTESQLTGGILLIIAVVLIYFVAYSPLRNTWEYLSSIVNLTRSSLPVHPGPLAAELNIETASALLVAICAVLYSFPTLRTAKGMHGLRLILSASGIAFGVGLLYFNFSMVSQMSNYVGVLSQYLVSVWIVFCGLLILGISGIMILIAGIMSLIVSVEALSTLAVLPRPSARGPIIEQPPPPPSMPQRYCRFCGAENKSDAIFCERCGKQII